MIDILMFHVSQGKTNERTNKIRFDRQKSQGGGGIGVKNCQFYLVKRQLRGGGGGQKSPILRRHSLWTTPNFGIGNL